uniref:Uncharacterized protein n=1 Tax=Papilio polytes TaxID=76194 RepID=I4DN55_PAPPL|nr:unknown unsecreted protein [Papilio polytes]
MPDFQRWRPLNNVGNDATLEMSIIPYNTIKWASTAGVIVNGRLILFVNKSCYFYIKMICI